MPYLFDTDAISDLLRPRPAPGFVHWLRTLERVDQLTSAVVVGELFKGAFRSKARQRHLANIEDRVLPRLTVLPYDTAVARVFGRLRADLELRGQLLPDADLQIAATAMHHGLSLVSGIIRHFNRILRLEISPIFAEVREAAREDCALTQCPCLSPWLGDRRF